MRGEDATNKTKKLSHDNSFSLTINITHTCLVDIFHTNFSILKSFRNSLFGHLRVVKVLSPSRLLKLVKTTK